MNSVIVNGANALNEIGTAQGSLKSVRERL